MYMTAGRKPKKRAPGRPKLLDDDLTLLASVIDEYRLDDTAYGWFRPPWRDGLNAMRLAREAAESPGIALEALGLPSEREAVDILYNHAPGDGSTIYERAGKAYCALVQPKVNTNYARLLAAALRCLQIKLARSDGGGTVYNEILIPVFLPLEPSSVEQLVMQHRCVDAIGTTPSLQGDHNDRQRQAFRIAWERGLYLAAYSLPPAY